MISMPTYALGKNSPTVHETCFIAPGAVIVGQVTVGPRTSIWFNAVIRGDISPVRIGSEVSIQDCCSIHADEGFPTIIGDRVTVGHGAVVHGAIIGAGALIGMRSVILDGAVVGERSLVGAGSLVSRITVPPRSLVLGAPAKVIRELTPEELKLMEEGVEIYLALAEQYERELRQV